MNRLRAFMKKRGLIDTDLDQQQQAIERSGVSRSFDDSENPAKLSKPQISKVYQKWLSEQSETVRKSLSKVQPSTVK